jgi:hypothetical protein
MAEVMLGGLGLSSASVKALIDDALDGRIDAPELKEPDDAA